MAALPLTLVSWSRGMYAISLQGSKREYFELFEKMFWAAPTKTAAIRGVIPSVAMNGVNGPENRTKPKKITPVINRTTGVMSAAVPHPNFLKMYLLAIIM